MRIPPDMTIPEDELALPEDVTGGTKRIIGREEAEPDLLDAANVDPKSTSTEARISLYLNHTESVSCPRLR